MKAALRKTCLLLFLIGLIQVAGGCIMEDRVIELVINETTCVDFYQNDSTVTFVNPVEVDYAEKLNEILDDNDISREDIVSARLVSASYGVTNLDPAHDDWIITGSITVERVDKKDGPETLWDYTSVAIVDALGKTIPAVLNGDGVGVLNRALEDFLAGGSPVLTFKVINSGVTPPPSVSVPIQFAWNGCIVVDIVAKSDIEVPDPL